MAWYDTKQAAVDPDNPAANEQIPFSEWNSMTAELRNKIINKTVNAAAIGDDKILVYDLASDTFVFETPTAVASLNDIPDVDISGVPALFEVLAYNGAGLWINRTAAEAGLATVTNLASYLPLTGGTIAGPMTLNGQIDVGGTLVMNEYYITHISRIYPHAAAIEVSGNFDMLSHNISNVVDPTSAQDASTKNYTDTHLFTKEAVTTFTDGYIPIYRTASGKFEMEEQSAALGLPVTDTTAIVKGSVDGTKLVRFEADGLSSGFTRVMTIPDKDMTIADKAEVMLLNGTQAMGANLDMAANELTSVHGITAGTSAGAVFYDDGGALFATFGASYSGENSFFENVNMNGRDITAIGIINLDAAMECTIATGAITVANSYHTVDTEADAATDDLTTINGGTEGQILIIRSNNSARTVVVKDATGNIQLSGDMSLDNIEDTLTMIYDGSNWLETGRSNNGA
ncbi:MAG: hypothetical protein DRI69_12190 [Bacteroidetes bacterium]|nr:MAG: hypothetical protein DRI69_12190 [Bacteroidota bacterium]